MGECSGSVPRACGGRRGAPGAEGADCRPSARGHWFEPATAHFNLRVHADSAPAKFLAAEASASGAVEEAAKVGALDGVHDPESSGGGTKRFRPVPTLGALAHHLEKVAQSLAVDVDLDVVAQRGGRVVEGDVDFAELGAEVLR